MGFWCLLMLWHVHLCVITCACMCFVVMVCLVMDGIMS